MNDAAGCAWCPSPAQPAVVRRGPASRCEGLHASDNLTPAAPVLRWVVARTGALQMVAQDALKMVSACQPRYSGLGRLARLFGRAMISPARA